MSNGPRRQRIDDKELGFYLGATRVSIQVKNVFLFPNYALVFKYF